MALSSCQHSMMSIILVLILFVLGFQVTGFSLFWLVQRTLSYSYSSLLDISKLTSIPCTFNSCVFLEVSMTSEPPQRIVVQLFDYKAPKTVEVFKALATGQKGVTSDGIRLHYEGTMFNRVVHGILIQGGDLYSTFFLTQK
ncbi:hypothetical protein KP509_1Z093500 [Ceratopteris richardii]|nr:hypothetical protein KP509_1Z093500 [Ceratopteris richardii]